MCSIIIREAADGSFSLELNGMRLVPVKPAFSPTSAVKNMEGYVDAAQWVANKHPLLEGRAARHCRTQAQLDAEHARINAHMRHAVRELTKNGQLSLRVIHHNHNLLPTHKDYEETHTSVPRLGGDINVDPGDPAGVSFDPDDHGGDIRQACAASCAGAGC